MDKKIMTGLASPVGLSVKQNNKETVKKVLLTLEVYFIYYGNFGPHALSRHSGT
jgi:hypothetical protein